LYPNTSCCTQVEQKFPFFSNFFAIPSLLHSNQEFKQTQAVSIIVPLISKFSYDNGIDTHSDRFYEQLAYKLWTSCTNFDAARGTYAVELQDEEEEVEKEERLRL